MQFVLNTIASASLGLLAALAFQPVLITNRAFILSMAIMFPAGGYAYLVASWAGCPPVLAGIVGVAFVASLSACMDWCLVRPLRVAGLPNWQMLVATLGIFVVGQNLLSLAFGDDPALLQSEAAKSGMAIFGAYIGRVQMLTVVFACAVTGVLWFIYSQTDLGRSIHAVFSNPDLAVILGHDVERIRLYAALICGVVAGLTGILVGLDIGATPILGFRLLLNGVVVILIAGLSGVIPMLAGALLVAFLQHLAAAFFGVAWMESVAFMILVGFLIWKPTGLSGLRLKKVEV